MAVLRHETSGDSLHSPMDILDLEIEGIYTPTPSIPLLSLLAFPFLFSLLLSRSCSLYLARALKACMEMEKAA
jgi:hypothetical protein